MGLVPTPYISFNLSDFTLRPDFNLPEMMSSLSRSNVASVSVRSSCELPIRIGGPQFDIHENLRRPSVDRRDQDGDLGASLPCDIFRSTCAIFRNKVMFRNTRC